MQKTEKYDLTQGSIARKLISFFLPVAAGTIVQQLYNTADAIIVGRFVGTEALAAVGGSTTQIINVLIGFFVALTSGASVIIAHFYGERDEGRISRSSNSSVIMCVVLGLLLTLVGELAAPRLLDLMNTPAETVDAASVYLRICFAAVVPVLIYNMGSGILRAVGDSQRPFWYLFACCMTNIALDLLFVAVMDWGVAGAAAATAFSQLVSCVLVLWRLFRTKEAYRISLKLLKVDRLLLKKMLYMGIPSGLQNTMFGLSNMIIQVGVNKLGTTVVAAWSLTGKVDGIYWAVSSAVGTAVMSFVGQNYGAGRMDRVRECVSTALKMFMGVTVVISAVIMVVGRPVLPFFTDDQQLMDYTWEIITYFVPYYFTWTAIEVLSGALKGGGDAVVPVVITGLGIAVFRSLWTWFVYGRLWNTLMGLSMSYVASWVVTDIAMVIRYRKWNRKQI